MPPPPVFWRNDSAFLLRRHQPSKQCLTSAGVSITGALLPAGDQKEKGEDDQEGEASHGCRDDDQHLALVGGHVWRWG